MSDLIEDHERGCAGREYTCTCGYDDAQADRIAALEAEVERLKSQGEAETTPTLILARLNDKIERLRKAGDALAKYTTHPVACAETRWYGGYGRKLARWPKPDCTCGLDEALAAWVNDDG